MDMKALLEAMTKFAGEPEQKAGDQVRGTEKAKKGSKDHPFKGRLVGGESTEVKGNMLGELSQEAQNKSVEWDLAEAWAQFKEEAFKDTADKRPARKGSREEKVGKRGHKEQPRYKKVNESVNDDASIVVAEVIKLIGEGHTEVSPDVITTKVSAALGRPFMLKDLVAANNSSEELQHYIDSINPSKIKFSTDILTVKNEDPMKEKAKAEAGVANMAARAASRPRLGESLEEDATELNVGDDVIITGPVEHQGETGVIDSFGQDNRFVIVNLYNHGKRGFHSSDVSYNEYADSDEEEADMYDRDADFRKWSDSQVDESVDRKQELKDKLAALNNTAYNYAMKGRETTPKYLEKQIAQVKAELAKLEEGWGQGQDRVQLPDGDMGYWNGTGPLQKEYEELYDKLVPAQGAADTIQGEVLRAASKIYYRHHNDGDDFNAASFEQLEPYIGKVTSYDDLAHKATEYAIAANGNYTPNNAWDSLDVMEYGPEDDSDDYEEDDSEWYEEPEEDDNELDDNEEEIDEVATYRVTDAPVDKEYVYTVMKTKNDVRDFKNMDKFVSLGTHHSLEDAKRVLANNKRTDQLGSKFKIVRTPRTKLAGPQGVLPEGWESGPDERAQRERDPDWEYDQRRQEKIDIEAEKEQARRPQEKVYTLVGRGPNMEPNYKFPGEYSSQEAAIAARERLMADPSTPNPRMIGISTHTRYLDEGRDTPLLDKEDYDAKKQTLQDLQMNPHTSKDPELSAELASRLARLNQQYSQLKEMVERVKESRGHKVLSTWFKNQELQDKFAKGELNIPTPAERKEQERIAKAKAEKEQVKEYGASAGSSAVGSGGSNPLDPNAVKKAMAATTQLKAATGSTAPAANLAKSLDAASQGQPISATDAKVVEPVMDIVKKASTDPKMATKFKDLAQQARLTP